jgi:hypothetical protein
MMKLNLKCTALATLLLAGCGGGGGYNSGSSPAPQQPAPPTPTVFGAFVKTQLSQTSDSSEPVDVNEVQFQFDEDETAFDDVLM